MQPESNQQSITSGTRFIDALHFAHGKVTSSIHGLCTIRCSESDGSFSAALLNAENARGFFASISATDAGASMCWHFSHAQMLSGVPQKRSRESAQSTLPFKKSPKRPSLMCSGAQVMC